MENKAKNKAEELIKKYSPHAYSNSAHERDLLRKRESIICALICVEEIIKSSPNNFINTGGLSGVIESPKAALVYWEEVREELNKMK